MGIFNRRAQEQVINKIKALHKKIEVIPGACRWNFRCHMNAVHEALDNNENEIAMVVYIEDGDYPVIHFLNYHKGKYTDNTLGHWCKKYEYYLIRFIDKSEFFDVNNILYSYRKELHKGLSFWTRIFTTCEF